MKKTLLTLTLSATLLAMLAAPIAEARSFGGRMGGFSSHRSYSSFRHSTPRYQAPARPIIVKKRTTIVQQNVTQNSGGGLGFFGTMLATGAGSYIGNRMAQPDPQPQVVQCVDTKGNAVECPKQVVK
jgi:hypothetical protein